MIMNYTSGGNKGVVPERGKGPAPVPKITGKEDIVNELININKSLLNVIQKNVRKRYVKYELRL